MNRGIIMEIKGKKAVVFSSECGMIRLPADPTMFVGQAISLDSSMTGRKAVRARRRIVPVLATALAVMMLIGAGGWLLRGEILSRSVAVTLSVDVNPSVNMMLNNEYTVIGMEARNEDAAGLLEGFQWKNVPYDEAVYRWLEYIRAQWDGEMSDVLVSAVLKEGDTDFEERLLKLEEQLPLESHMRGVNVTALFTRDRDLFEKAEENGLSIGRQLLLELADEETPGIRAGQISDVPIGQLISELVRSDQHQVGRNDDKSPPSEIPNSTSPAGTQSRATARETEQTGEGTTATRRETQRATNTSESAATGTSRATARETEQTGAGSTAATSTSQATVRETEQTGTGTTATLRETENSQQFQQAAQPEE